MEGVKVCLADEIWMNKGMILWNNQQFEFFIRWQQYGDAEIVFKCSVMGCIAKIDSVLYMPIKRMNELLIVFYSFLSPYMLFKRTGFLAS